MPSYGTKQQPPVYLTTPARIAKSDIARLGELRGAANEDVVTLDDGDHPSGTLTFEGFAGSLQDDGFYGGVFRFLPYNGEGGRWFSNADLPGFGAE